MAGLYCVLFLLALVRMGTSRSIGPVPDVSNAGSSDNNTEAAGHFSVHMLQVGQGDSQLIVFPSGYSILIDVSEKSWNSCAGAQLVAEKVVNILGHKHVDVGSPSHWHLDHLGYAGYGGFWCLIERDLLSFGKIVDRDGGVWLGAAASNQSESMHAFRPGTATNETGPIHVQNSSISSPEYPFSECSEETIEWHNVGTLSGTAVNWVCHATDPNNHKIYNIREVAKLHSSTQIVPPDNNARVTVVAVDGHGAYLKDGLTQVSGDHRNDKLPPSENDYCIGLLVEFGNFVYLTAGDSDGSYGESSWGYTYNDVETPMAAVTKKIEAKGIDVLHVNHHGSSHSSNAEFLASLTPRAALISCGYNNTHDHPAQATIDRLEKSHSDTYYCQVCAIDRKYGADAHFAEGDVELSSHDHGHTYSIMNNLYTSKRTVL